MSNGPLTKRVCTKRSANSTAAGTTTLTQTTVSMRQGGVSYNGVRCIVLLGDVTATALAHLKAYQGKVSDGSDKAALSGTSAQSAAGASDQDNKLLIVDVYKPLEPYVTFELVRGTANIVVDGILFELYEPREAVITEDSTVLSETCLVEADEA